MNFSLSIYTIRIEPKQVSNQGQAIDSSYIDLDNFNENGDDLFEVLKTYLEKIKADPIKNENQKIHFGISEFNVYNRLITGIIDTGVYGLGGKIIDTETNSISYKKKSTDADSLPFFFLLSIPKNRNEGLLILERIGNNGIRKHLSKLFNRYFSSLYSSLSLSLNPLILDTVIQQFLFNGTIKKLRFIKYQIPSDKVDGFDGGHKEMPMNLEIAYSASRLEIYERIKSFFNGSREVKNLFELKDFNLDYDTIKLDVTLGSQEKVINLSDFTKVRNYINITNDIEIDSDGFPTFKSIELRAIELHKQFSDLMYKS